MSKPRRRKQKKQVKPELKLRQFAALELADRLAGLPCAADLPRFRGDTVAGAYAPADAELMICLLYTSVAACVLCTMLA